MANPTSNFGWQMPTSTDLVTDLPADFEVFGQAVDTTLVDLKGGTSGQILAKNSNTDMDFVWIANDQGDITGVTASSPLTGGGTSGAITVGIQDASTSQKGAVQLTDSTSTTSSTVAATATAVKSAYDLANTASTNNSNITMIQQYTATESVLKNIPSRVPVAEQLLKQAVYWIDAAQSDNSDQVLDNQGWGAPALTTQLGSSASADSNDPKFLDFDGTNYFYAPGVASNNLTIPDATNLDITGDIDIRVRLAADDWTPSAINSIFNKWTAAGAQQSWLLYLLTDGKLQFSWSTTGSDTLNAVSTVATGISDGSVKWVRATLDVDNGASGYDVKFFTSDDGITWTQLGTTVTGVGTTSIFSSSSNLQIGTITSTSFPLAGKVYRAQVLNGIAGTKVLDVDTSVIGSGSAASFNALTGQTVTINRSTSGKKSAVVTHPVWLFGTDDYMEVADNDLLDFAATDSFTVLAIFRQWGTNDSYIAAKRNGSASTSTGYSVINISGSTYFGISDGTNNTNALKSYTSGGLSVSTTVRNVTTDNLIAYNNAVAGTAVTDATTATLANALALRIGAYPTAVASTLEGELFAAAIFRTALTTDQITTITNYYTARIGA